MFGPRIDHVPPRLYNKAEAENTASKLRSGDPEWTYTVEPHISTCGGPLLYKVATYDELGHFVGYW